MNLRAINRPGCAFDGLRMHDRSEAKMCGRRSRSRAQGPSPLLSRESTSQLNFRSVKRGVSIIEALFGAMCAIQEKPCLSCELGVRTSGNMGPLAEWSRCHGIGRLLIHVEAPFFRLRLAHTRTQDCFFWGGAVLLLVARRGTT